MHYLGYVLLSAIFTTLGGYMSKGYVNRPDLWALLPIFVTYNLGTAAWMIALTQKKSLAIVGSIMSLTNLVAAVVIGTYFFDEPIDALHGLGISLAALAVLLLTR